MKRVQDCHLLLATDRLRWALGISARMDVSEWCNRLGRALDNLEAALAGHVAWTSSRRGPFAELDDPLLLPLTAISQQIRRWRDEHLRFHRQLRLLQADLRSARRQIITPAEANGSRPGGAVLARLLRRGGAILEGLDVHRAAEQGFLSARRRRGSNRPSTTLSAASRPAPEERHVGSPGLQPWVTKPRHHSQSRRDG